MVPAASAYIGITFSAHATNLASLSALDSNTVISLTITESDGTVVKNIGDGFHLKSFPQGPVGPYFFDSAGLKPGLLTFTLTIAPGNPYNETNFGNNAMSFKVRFGSRYKIVVSANGLPDATVAPLSIAPSTYLAPGCATPSTPFIWTV